MPVGHFNLLGLLIFMVCLRGRDRASIKLAGNFQTNNKQRRSDMTKTDRTAPKGDMQGSYARALSDIEINLKGGG